MTKEDAIREMMFAKRNVIADSFIDKAYDMAIEALKAQKAGKWINCKYPLGECSECHAIVDIQNNEANYCPVCGSRNRGGIVLCAEVGTEVRKNDK